MKRRYKYKLDRRAKRLTLIISLIIIGLGTYFFFNSTSLFLPAWFFLFALALLALVVLSIPRFVKVDDDSFEIHCLVELTRIDIGDVKSIYKVDRRSMKYCFPLLGSYGFFGYFGYYFNFAEMSVFKIYASKWDDFVRVEDIYEDVYIINCDNADELIHFVNKARLTRLRLQGVPEQA